jgi:hypothetical protein
MSSSHTTCTPAIWPNGRRNSASLRSDRPSGAAHKDPVRHGSTAAIRAREDLFDSIRLSRRIAGADLDTPAGIVSFPTSVIVGTTVADVSVSLQPGLVPAGTHIVQGRLVALGLIVTGELSIVVGDEEPAPAVWSAHRSDGSLVDVPAEIADQLPSSMRVRRLTGTALRGAVRRVHMAAEQARAELIQGNRGLVRTVVNRYRSVVRAEATALELDDLMIVGEHQMLDTADRFFTDPDLRPVRDVAWSKLVQRSVGNAVRTEIARATGISVEFRQLLSWFHAHPEDRSLPVEVIAQRMALSAGTTRLMAQKSMTNRTAATRLLEDMLACGDAMYVEPGRDAAARAKDLRADGVFVISSRSSYAEIERARSFQGAHALTLDDTVGDDQGSETRGSRIGSEDARYDESDNTDVLRRTILQTGMSPVEALVWLHRTGALDPNGHAVELPEIADELGLADRSEARAALRRARRKLDTWMVTSAAGDLRVMAS